MRSQVLEHFYRRLSGEDYAAPGSSMYLSVEEIAKILFGGMPGIIQEFITYQILEHFKDTSFTDDDDMYYNIEDKALLAFLDLLKQDGEFFKVSNNLEESLKFVRDPDEYMQSLLDDGISEDYIDTMYHVVGIGPSFENLPPIINYVNVPVVTGSTAGTHREATVPALVTVDGDLLVTSSSLEI
jgi:hypothetical protein